MFGHTFGIIAPEVIMSVRHFTHIFDTIYDQISFPFHRISTLDLSTKKE